MIAEQYYLIISFAIIILKEEKLWNACYTGDIEQVKELITEGRVNLNWKRPDMSVSANL